MVRNIAGALADAGTGKLTPKDLREILEAKTENSLAPPLLPTDSAFSKYTSRLLQRIDGKTICGSYAPWSV